MKKKSHPEFVRALKARNLKITVVGTYENCLSRVAVRCDVCGWEWAPVGGSLLRGHGCPKCAGTMRKSHAEFVEELKSRRDDVIIVGPYVKALEKTRFRFLKCGHEWDVTPAHILNGRGCPLCAHSRRGASQRLTMERFLKRLHKIDRNLVVREGGKYVNYTTPIPLRCNACKYEYEVKPGDVLHGGGCPNCHRACTSFPEQFIRHAFVRMLGESEVLSRDKTAAGVELDVCIPALRAAVEPGSWYWHRNLVERDREKRLLCERKGIRLITVYDHYDETAVPFDDCLVTPCDLASRRNMDKLVAVTKTLLGAFGLDSNLAAGEWEAAGTFEFRRLAATLADRRAADAVFGGGFPKRVEHLTGGDAPYLPASSSQHRPNGAFPAAGRAGFRDEAIRLRRPYMAAGPALECHAGLAVDILGQRDDLRMQQVQSFDEPFMREFQPAGTAGASRTPAQGRGRNGPLVIADLAPHPDFIRGPRVFADNLDFIIDPGQLRPEFFGGHPPRIQFGPPPDGREWEYVDLLSGER